MRYRRRLENLIALAHGRREDKEQMYTYSEQEP